MTKTPGFGLDTEGDEKGRMAHRKNFNRLILLGFFAVVMASGCATVPQQPISAVYLSDLCSRHNIQWQWDAVSQTVTLKKSGARAQALIGSKIVVVENEQITLSEPLRRLRGSILVPGDFENKVIIRMEGSKLVSLKGPWTIVIDPGHGGKDPGAISRSGLAEKKVVLDIARKLRDSLERRGFKVFMTRDRDEFITLERRTEIASRSKADLYVSIHANSSPSSAARGVEVYTIRNLDYKEKKEDQRLKNLKVMYGTLSMRRDDPELHRIISDMLYDYKRAESQQAASALARGLSQATDSHSRGAKEAGYFVLRNTLIPAVLVEVGFLSNPREEKQLATSVFRTQVAESLADNIASYAARRWE